MAMNYFLEVIIDKFLEPHMQIHYVTMKQALLTFISLMEAQLKDYRNSERYGNGKWKKHC